MKYWLAVLALFFVGGLVVYSGLLYTYPSLIMQRTEAHLAELAGGYNHILYDHRPTAKTRAVVRPSPNQLHSVCVYDLADGPVVFTGQVPDGYFSLSFHGHNTDNFFVANDRQLESGAYRFILIESDANLPDGVDPDRVIRAPSRTGIALTRLFIPGPERFEALSRVQKSADCAPLSG